MGRTQQGRNMVKNKLTILFDCDHTRQIVRAPGITDPGHCSCIACHPDSVHIQHGPCPACALALNDKPLFIDVGWSEERCCGGHRSREYFRRQKARQEGRLPWHTLRLVECIGHGNRPAGLYLRVDCHAGSGASGPVTGPNDLCFSCKRLVTT